MDESVNTMEGVEAGQETAETPDFGGGAEESAGLDLPGLTQDSEGEDLSKRVEQLEVEKAGLLDDLRSTRSRNQERMALLEDRLSQINDRLTPREDPNADPEPDREEEPMAWIAWDRRRQDAKLDRIEERLTSDDEAEQQRQVFAQVIQAGRLAEDEYIKQSGTTREEYLGKLTAVRDSRIEYYEAYGYTAEQAKGIVAREEIAWMTEKLQNHENPARMVVEAFNRLGLADRVQKENPNAEQDKVAGKKSLNAIEAAKAGQKTGGINDAEGSGAGGVVLSLAQLSEMSDDDFNKAMDYLDKNPKKWKELNIAGKTMV